jgi:hypothetical protein
MKQNMQDNNDILNSISFDENKEKDILSNINLEPENTTNKEEENKDILSIVQEIETVNLEIKVEEKSKENQKLQDILKEFSQEEEIVESEVTQKSIAKKTNIFISSIVFLFKYILTSSFIFAILLVATNYNSYIEIARSYLNPEALEVTKNSMYASINSTSLSGSDESLQEQTGGKSIEEEMKLEEKMNMVKNKTYHSMEKLV